MNSAILDASTSTAVRSCVEWLACQVDTKDRMWDSASGPSVYRGYGYGMVSGNSGKELCSGWLTSGGLDGEIGSEPTCDKVSCAGDCKWCASDSSGEDCWVSAESEVPSTGSGRRAGGRDRVMRLGAVMAAEGCLLRSSL